MSERWVNRLHRLQIRKVLIFLAFNIFATLILLEFAVRLWGYSARYIYNPIYMPFEESHDIPYVLQPNLRNIRARGQIQINTDAMGLRSIISGKKYTKKQDNEYHIAIVGDSYTFGTGVKNEETFSQVLEDFLNHSQQKVKVKVFNFGVPAYSVKEMVATLKHRMFDTEPDLVIMSIIPGDFNLNRTPQKVDRWGYTTNTYLDDSLIKLFLRKIHLTYILRDITYKLKRSGDQKNDLSSAKHRTIPETYNYIIKFKEIAEKNKTPYLIVTLTSFKARGFQDMNIDQKFQKDNIKYYDLTDVTEQFTEEEYRVSQFDEHPSAKAHKEFGERLGRHILHNFLR